MGTVEEVTSGAGWEDSATVMIWRPAAQSSQEQLYTDEMCIEWELGEVRVTVKANLLWPVTVLVKDLVLDSMRPSPVTIQERQTVLKVWREYGDSPCRDYEVGEWDLGKFGVTLGVEIWDYPGKDELVGCYQSQDYIARALAAWSEEATKMQEMDLSV